MKKVLILNHKHIECGVYQIAVRIFKIASQSKKINYSYAEVSDRREFNTAIYDHRPDYIIYNYHWDRMPWLRDADILLNKKIKHYFIYHDGSMMTTYDKYLFFGAFDPQGTDVSQDKRILLPRPIYRYSGYYPTNDLPTIGSFGFAFNHKKFHAIAPYVGSQFDKAVVNLHFTNPYFGDTPGNRIADIIDLCYGVCPQNVKLNITTNFMDDNAAMTFLAGNDINLFLYDTALQNPGISSAIDYALSVRRPIAISNNMMFRHIASDDILIEKNTIKNIINRGTDPLERFYTDWSPEKFTDAMENLFI